MSYEEVLFVHVKGPWRPYLCTYGSYNVQYTQLVDIKFYVSCSISPVSKSTKLIASGYVLFSSLDYRKMVIHVTFFEDFLLRVYSALFPL